MDRFQLPFALPLIEQASHHSSAQRSKTLAFLKAEMGKRSSKQFPDRSLKGLVQMILRMATIPFSRKQRLLSQWSCRQSHNRWLLGLWSTWVAGCLQQFLPWASLCPWPIAQYSTQCSHRALSPDNISSQKSRREREAEWWEEKAHLGTFIHMSMTAPLDLLTFGKYNLAAFHSKHKSTNRRTWQKPARELYNDDYLQRQIYNIN